MASGDAPAALIPPISAVWVTPAMMMKLIILPDSVDTLGFALVHR